MQIDLLPNLPTSGGYQTVMTAIDVFSRYFFAYPLIEATVTNVAKVIIGIMTKHSYLPTTLITDKGSAFTSTIIAEITQILGLTLKCATTKHPQTIGKLERTHASLKNNLKMASGEYRRQWHKYSPLAVLNYKTTYHSIIGCEPSKVFHGRILFNVLDHKLGNNPNKTFFFPEFAEEVQQRTQILIDQTKKNIMQSYLKYKDYYDRKAKAAPLKEKVYCFVLQPKADSQASKILFREYRWIGPFVVQTVLSNDNYIVRRLKTNKTQILHRIRLKKIVPNAPLEDKHDGEKLQPDNEILIPQDDLYTISWKVDFEYELFEPRKDDWTEDAEDGSVEHYVIENERGSASETESHSERSNEDDATENKTRTQSRNSRDMSSPLDEKTNGTQNENDVTNDLQDAGNVSNRGADITVPGISEKENSEENSSSRGGRYNLRPNPNPNFTDEYRY